MTDALCIGGTRFIGRHTVEELLAHDYSVATFSRGESGDPFADTENVTAVRGDRNERADLEAARDAHDPDYVFDFVGMVPEHVETATEVFADCEAYVYVSSGSSYAEQDVPMREGETPLHEYDRSEDDADPMESVPELYGPRKAACDRAVFAAADAGVNATAVRPMLVYGPHDYTERLDYWIARVLADDRVLVPGDGGSLFHRAYVGDVASALRLVAERGEAGAAYNVADRNTQSLRASLDRIAAAADTEVEVVTASARELAAHDLDASAFPLYSPAPLLAATDDLAALGWDSTDPVEAYAATVADHRASDRDGSEVGPDPEATAAALDALGE
ncbi:NAD-dependent epimerase/dehydratase family protein [Halosegnis marinus]|uniref:NAD-dependent epimerase/dehydratase family protein n=1 Tax=Halosegnis marinus TaxID=3034023 RepID=A0ABD5ZQ96_9EURY|nr:NAD-dependent epimerase/dehydratase family protein [Halosegnis sp. DT85]